MINRKVATKMKNVKYFHEVWPKEEAELKISLEASRAAKLKELRHVDKKEKKNM